MLLLHERIRSVTSKKRYRKGIEILKMRIQEHEDKIKRELERGNPDYGLIDKWNKDIQAFIDAIRRKEKRL